MLEFLNQAIFRVVARRPDLFAVASTNRRHIPKAGVIQVLDMSAPPDRPPHRLIDVIGGKDDTGYHFLKETTFETFQTTPAPNPVPAGIKDRIWARYPKVPNMFIVSPPFGDDARNYPLDVVVSASPLAIADPTPDNDVVVNGVVTQFKHTFDDSGENPNPIANDPVDNQLTLPGLAFHPALVYGTAAIASSRMSEARVIAHASLWQSWFEIDLNADLLARAITDDNEADVNITNVNRQSQRQGVRQDYGRWWD